MDKSEALDWLDVVRRDLGTQVEDRVRAEAQRLADVLVVSVMNTVTDYILDLASPDQDEDELSLARLEEAASVLDGEPKTVTATT